MRELNTLAMRSRISRIEAIHGRTLIELAELSEKLQETDDAHLYRAYVENYYQNVYDYHRTIGLPQPPASLDAKRVESVLRTAWSGKNYSARIWANRSKLAKEIQRSMMTAIHRGSSIQQLSKDLAQRMEVGYKNAERLIRTELNAVENKASADAMKDAEFTHYQFMATLDRRTCARCGERDGEIFALADMNQGENAPPLHPRCRCTIVATFDTPKGKSRTTQERAARETNRERAPADMNYKDWRAIYIDKNKTFDAWRAEKDAQYKAAEAKPEGTPKWKRQEHFSTSDDNIKATNPNYRLGQAFQNNCQKCVPTYEMRMRGYDVTARPTFDLKTDGFAQDYWRNAFKGAKFEEGFAGSGKKEVIDRMKLFGDGARGEIYVAWQEGEAHVFVAENRNGAIHFLDPQTGGLDVEYYFDHVKDGLTKLLRIDNLESDEKNIKWCCKETKHNADT